METIVKQAREVGTSAGVLLPRKWLNKQVVVTLFSPSIEDVAEYVFKILIEKGLNEEIKGIYLFGSYARGDYDSDSDIDVLVITKSINKLMKHENYDILLVSENSFSENLPASLAYMSLLKEIKVIINKELIDKYISKGYVLNLRKILPEIRRVVKINKDAIEECKENNKNIPDGIVYSVVLRLRELYIIRCLISNKNYSKKDFLKISGDKSYSAYNRVKRDEDDIGNVSPDEIINALKLSEKWLKDLKE